MIKLNNINKKFGDKIVFDQASLMIDKGEFIAIKGASGSGKTTLLNIIGLLDSFNSGEYFIEKQKINEKNKEKIRHKTFSYVFQSPYLIDYMNGYENIVLPLKNKKIKINKDLIEENIKVLGLESILYKNVSLLSGGEKTRISIGRALACENQIMLCDEPTGNLDPTNAKNVMSLLYSINKSLNITIVIVTHSNDFDSLFNRILWIKDGKINENIME